MPFCPRCGGRSIEEVSRPTTGGAAAAVAPARYPVPPPQPKEREPDAAIWVLLPILVVGIWFAATSARQLQGLSAESHREQIASTPVTVSAHGYYYYTFEVPPDTKNATIDGRFSAAGGSRNDVEASILPKDEFENWKNGQPSQAFYQSGRVNRGRIHIRVPGDGVYYLVLDNQFSPSAAKDVEIEVALTYNR
jgi:hypothetical protein